MKRSVAAVLAVLTLAAALPAAALDWSNSDPVAGFKLALKQSPAPQLAPVKGVVVAETSGKPTTGYERWANIMTDAQNGTAISKEDASWAADNFDRMSRKAIRRSHLRRQIRRKVNEQLATWPKDERPSWNMKREAINIAAAKAKLTFKEQMTAILDKAKVK